MTRKLRNDGRPIDVSSRVDELIDALSREPDVLALYLYGSYGTRYQTPLSDVDLAILLRPEADRGLDAMLHRIGLVTRTLREDDVSITILNDAPVPFQLDVLRRGRRLLVTDEVAHADFVERVIDEAGDFMFDFERLLEDYDRGLVLAYGSG